MAALRVAFVHPFLGLGGAERLIVDAAVWLQQAGHSVTMLTTHHDPERSFPPARDGTLDVGVHGDFLPAQVFGRLRAPCAIARMMALAAAARPQRGRFDVVVCDLVAHIVPVIRASLGAPVLFYCHYPDRLLVPQRRSWYRAYRWPIDAAEAAGMRRADAILVNSRYTRGVFERVFPGRAAPEVLYPAVDCDAYAQVPPVAESPAITLLSIARFDAKKNLGLAVETLAHLRARLAPDLRERVRLVIAGGYDASFPEGPAVLDGLRRLAASSGVEGQVEFVLNADAATIVRLLGECRCVLYTPRGEHLGIVPLEAMAAARPVIAVNEGGPIETILDGRTGFLCAPTADAFAEAAMRCIEDPVLARDLGCRGREHVHANFSRERFGRGFEAALRRIVRGGAT